MINFLKYNIGKLALKHYMDNGLYCFNYHRIGDPLKTKYDPNVFSCTPETFETHLTFYKEYFTIIDVDYISTLSDEDLKTGRYAVVTFDDGYQDNFTEAFPILHKHKTPAVFFLATDFIDDNQVPWWDLIAFYINTTQKRKIKLPEWLEPVCIPKYNRASAIREILSIVKLNNCIPLCEQVTNIKEFLASEQEPESGGLFMTWDNASEMKKQGMKFGSQTCSHRILSHLTLEEQKIELQQSKDIIESRLNLNNISFAYPVGSGDSFTKETIDLVSEIYPIAFSFMPGVNFSLGKSKYTIKRFSIDNNCSIKELAYRLIRNKMNFKGNESV